MATNPHPQPALNDPPDSGTPVINYVGPASLAQRPTPTPEPLAPEPQAPEQPTAADEALSGAKRVAFALLGVLLGTTIYYNIILNVFWLNLLQTPFNLAFILAAAYVVEKRSSYTQWGTVAVVSTTLIAATLPNGLLYDQGTGYLTVALGAIVLAGYAVIKSLRPWRAGAGLLLIAAAVAGSLTSLYSVEHFNPGDPNSKFQQVVASFQTYADLDAWRSILAGIIPLLLIILYLWPRRQQPDTPPNVKSEG